MFPINSPARIWYAVLLCAAVMLLFGTAPPPALAHCDGVKHGDGHPHCSDSGGDGNTSTSTLSACDEFRDDAGDIVKSDQPGVRYCHKVDGNVVVGERHRLDTNKLDPGPNRLAEIIADGTHCTSVGDASNPFVAFADDTEIALQLRGKQDCTPSASCNCGTDFAGCTAENFITPGSTPAELRAMATDDVAWRALTLGFTPPDRHLVTLAFNHQDDDSQFPCPDGGMPVKVTCLNTDSSNLCDQWTIEGKAACFLEAPRRSAGATLRAQCQAPFSITVEAPAEP